MNGIDKNGCNGWKHNRWTDGWLTHPMDASDEVLMSWRLSSSETVVASSSMVSGAGIKRGLDVATGSVGLALPADGADAADAASVSLSLRSGRGLVVMDGTGILGADRANGFDSVGLDGVDPAPLNLRTSEGLSSVPLAAPVPLSESFRLRRRCNPLDPLTAVSLPLPFCNRIRIIVVLFLSNFCHSTCSYRFVINRFIKKKKMNKNHFKSMKSTG